MTQRLNRIERIGEAVPACGLWHELCDARGTLWAHGAGIEAALLPDYASEKFYGKAILCRSLFQRPANIAGCGRIRSRALRFAWRRRFSGLLMPRCRRCGARLRIRMRASQGECTGKQRSDQSGHAGLTYEIKFGAATARHRTPVDKFAGTKLLMPCLIIFRARASRPHPRLRW
jgi:hypothetical protein